jgi:hypothetical protein
LQTFTRLHSYNRQTKMNDLFDTPLKKVKVRNGIFAYKYRNGTININGTKFLFYSMKDAIKKWRNNNPK